ncbi:SDR family oxidoreductase [Goodfellowiella coeruleoviolacea]|uniref:NAD(P)-dependent dehydrogenase, short-chain alcohol dehydrogenase family n=1 Tax=Goodfellowiella coeruleoviolacea TaxID=334858 RepID=A0AAE3GIS7_9PSEU|nr:SDR family oxidoreductase [Goodfellowiella coeruleoviolacea]MCP2168393.1 NAD(P)-dependent dehydrogenase, short-chain alcohol dehydrogenase family [Goodfellowiella coeruleoviolacea]
MSDRVVIVGGTSGIGLATARRLIDDGHQVVVTGRDQGRLHDALATLGEGATGEVVDARDAEASREMFARLGSIDHLVVAATGSRGMGALRDLDLAEVRAAVEDKLLAHLTTAQAALGALRADGSITFVTAITAEAAMPGTAGIGAVNGAVATAVPTLAVELAPMRVNAVSPGVVDTPWWDFLDAEARQASFSAMAATTPVGRVGRPEDVAGAIAFLVGNSFVTGVVLPVDGGVRLRAAG